VSTKTRAFVEFVESTLALCPFVWNATTHFRRDAAAVINAVRLGRTEKPAGA
jgi:hypothetical protein